METKLHILKRSHLEGVVQEPGALLVVGKDISGGLAAAWVANGIAEYATDSGEVPTQAVAVAPETATAEPEVETADTPAPKKRGRPKKTE